MAAATPAMCAIATAAVTGSSCEATSHLSRLYHDGPSELDPPLAALCHCCLQIIAPAAAAPSSRPGSRSWSQCRQCPHTFSRTALTTHGEILGANALHDTSPVPAAPTGTQHTAGAAAAAAAQHDLLGSGTCPGWSPQAAYKVSEKALLLLPLQFQQSWHAVHLHGLVLGVLLARAVARSRMCVLCCAVPL